MAQIAPSLPQWGFREFLSILLALAHVALAQILLCRPLLVRTGRAAHHRRRNERVPLRSQLACHAPLARAMAASALCLRMRGNLGNPGASQDRIACNALSNSDAA